MPFNPLEFVQELLKIPSISADANYAGEVERCARVFSEKIASLGFETELVKTSLHPIIWAERNSKTPAKIRILCYGHYDVQPIDPIEKWNKPPFEPAVENGRLWGRGSADNKGPFMCLFGGLMRFLEKNPEAPVDIALMIEGEEEISSPSMPEFIKSRKEKLSSYDAILLSDTSSASDSQIVITTGLRGVLAFDVKFRGPNSDIHSGMFGGAVLNPIQAMAEVCASLHKDGLVDIDGFYDDVLPIYDWEKRDIARYPFNEEKIMESLGVNSLIKQGDLKPSEALRLLPALEFTGIGGGYQGEGNKSVIPSEAFCKISIRLVPDQNGRKIYELVKKAIIERCPKGVVAEVSEPDGIGDAYCVIPPNREGAPNPYPEKLGKIFGAVEDCVKQNFGNPPIFLREGASIPLLSLLKKETGLDSVMTGLFSPLDNLHAPNESFSLTMMERALNYYEALFERISK